MAATAFTYDAFISYRHEEPDRAFARQILSRLEAAGFTAAIDERDFDPSETFLDEMERCVKESRFTLCVVSPRYFQSGNTHEEAVICKVIGLQERRRRLVPLIHEKVEMPVWMFNLVGVDFTASDPLVDPFDKLTTTLRSHVARSSNPAVALSPTPARAPIAPPQPAIANQTNVAGNQDNAQRDLTHAERDSYHAEHDQRIHHHYGAGNDGARRQFENLHQISEPVPDFVGREEEIARILAAFEDSGRGAVISGVRGMGGVGKTELAKVVAKRLRGRFPHGQIVFDLRGARDDDTTTPATVGEALTHAIRSFEPEARLPEDVAALQGIYRSVLDGKRVLLLMDNALDARQLTPLVPPPEGCALIVTSRHAISLAGMKPVDLDMLPSDKARALLLEICPRIGAQADTLAQTCGYLPLALRLAASALERNRPLSVEGYLARLNDEHRRLEELDRDRDMVAVDRGITATLAASYTVLDAPMQRRWRALGVFPGDFDTPAAASVWELEHEQAVQVLADLHAASMVQWEEARDRYRLHDLAHDYARAQSSDAERMEDAQRHAAHYAEILSTADDLFLDGGDSIAVGLALFDREWSNIRTGQAWAATHWNVNAAAATLCSDYPDAGAYCLALRQHSRHWIAWLETAVKAARTLEDRDAEGNHLGNLGLVYAALGEPRKAIEYHEQALAISREIGDRRGEGAVLGNLGNAYADLGEPRKAIEFYEQQLAIVQEIGDRRGEGNALGNLGDALEKIGRRDEAIAHAAQAVEIFEQIKSPYTDQARALLERLRK